MANNNNNNNNDSLNIRPISQAKIPHIVIMRSVLFSLVLCLALPLCLWAAVPPRPPAIKGWILHDKDFDPEEQWRKFQKEFKKVYPSREEENLRFQVFKVSIPYL